MNFETFKYVGSIQVIPFITICYDSLICERAVSFGWLWWGITIVRKNEMHL